MKQHERKLFIDEIKNINISLSEKQVNQFNEYIDILLEWNEHINLTAITNVNEILMKHFYDSLVFSQFITLDNDISIMDVGTGAGFPGVPLKIVFPDIRLTLLDSLRKRTDFLQFLCKKLSLDSVTILNGRAEKFGREALHRDQYHYVVSRAVAPLRILSEFCLPFVKNNGLFISFKGPDIDTELQDALHAIDVLGGKVEDIKSITLPYQNDKRTLIMIRKVNMTPEKFPRREGIPAKRPL